jgi:hypothetical protein
MDAHVILRRALLTVGIAVALGGCGGSGGGGGNGGSSIPKGFGGAVGSTKPGAQLSIGQIAHLTFAPTRTDTDVNDPQRIQVDVSVMSIRMGSISDLSAFDLNAQQKASVPYFVTGTVTNNGAPFSTQFSAPGVAALDAHGNAQSSTGLLLGNLKQCPQVNAPKLWKTGQSVTSCDVYLMPQGSAIVSAQYNGTPAYAASPVTWR